MANKVVCIEDNPQNSRLIRKMLGSAGYHVIEAGDGASGHEAVLRERPALILMDVNLPDIDGLELTQRIKANPELQHIPVVALTANAMYGDRERCLAAGCNDYLPKPVTKSMLLSTVASLLGDAAPTVAGS
ncbi:MAG: response regulator [Anaerolineae bacterium]|nr:response regulator [Anaerolineae bacterium]NUQ03489.1 response regulator [Anaerolineae bacterium]